MCMSSRPAVRVRDRERETVEDHHGGGLKGTVLRPKKSDLSWVSSGKRMGRDGFVWNE